MTSHPHSVNSERFRALRTNLLFAQRTQGIKSVLIISSVLSEGKSFVAVNLATVLAQTNKKVLLVDADLSKPTLHTILNLENEEGLTSLQLEDSLDADEVIQFASTSNLHFLPSGPSPSNSSKLLMKRLKWRYDFIIYDTSPAMVTDSSVLASDTDGVLLVVRHDYTKKDDILNASKKFKTINANILGYIYNDISSADFSVRQRYYLKDV